MPTTPVARRLRDLSDSEQNYVLIYLAVALEEAGGAEIVERAIERAKDFCNGDPNGGSK